MKLLKRIALLFVLVLVVVSCAPPAAPQKFYLPMILEQNQSVLGVQMEGNSLGGRNVYLANESAIHLSLRWSEVEAIRGTYSWITTFDTMAATVAENRFFILNLKNAPAWARAPSTLQCYAPKVEFFDEFANFVVAAIDRYHPDAIEIWNEPDVQPQAAIDNGYWYGCIGNGTLYAQILGVVYPIVKAHHPSVVVLGGALMLGETQHKFTEDFLAYTIASPITKYNQSYPVPAPKLSLTSSIHPFDGVSYHAYITYPSTNFDYVFGKADYLATLTDKQLWVTETALLCQTDCGTTFKNSQTNYLTHVYSNAYSHGLNGLLWYSLANNGWLNSDLVAKDVKKPVWYEYCDFLGGCE